MVAAKKTRVAKKAGRPIGAKNLTLREQRFKAEAAVLKAENAVLKAKLEVSEIKAKEAQARIKTLTSAAQSQ